MRLIVDPQDMGLYERLQMLLQIINRYVWQLIGKIGDAVPAIEQWEDAVHQQSGGSALDADGERIRAKCGVNSENRCTFVRHIHPKIHAKRGKIGYNLTSVLPPMIWMSGATCLSV